MTKILLISICCFASMLLSAQQDESADTFLDSIAITLPLQLESEVYGSHCGIAGVDPPLRLAIEQCIKEGEHRVILDWLDGCSLTRQVYAVEAISRLDQVNWDLSEDQWERIGALMTSKASISTCSGCFRMNQEVGEIVSDFVITP